MANKLTDRLLKNLRDADNKTTMALSGTTNELDLEDITLRDIIHDSTLRSSKKYGEHTDGRNLDYFTELGLASMMSDSISDKASKEDKKEAKEDPTKYFKKYMENNGIADRTALFMGDLAKYIQYNNYEAINKHIPECAAALNVYVNNIISPDDFTKTIFNYNYVESVDEEKVNSVKSNIDYIIKKYKMNIKTEEIVKEACMKGDAYYAILSLDKELSAMLEDPLMDKSLLQEHINNLDTSSVNVNIDGSDINLNESDTSIFEEFLNISDDEKKAKDYNLNSQVASFINEHFVIGTKAEMLQERAEYEFDIYRSRAVESSSKKSKKNEKNKKMYLNGSVVRHLKPENTIELELDDFSYGYYYIEERDYVNSVDASAAGDYIGMTSGRNAGGNTYSMTAQGATAPLDNGVITGATNYNKDKVRVISDIFINAIAKKIDKDYVRHNKKFKDFIYSVVREKYLQKKQIKITYFSPDEVVHFKVPSVYKDIVFFAKLYLAMLTNYMIINIGRAHDKRVLYVQSGLDEQYEQAVSNVIESIKTKEFRLTDTDINTVLQLNPGALDDYFIPMINGERAVEIETIAGMDADITNNGFLDWLRKSMMNGMCVPSNLIDVMAEVDYARQLSQQNTAFVRNIVRYQILFQPEFEKFMRKLYENEYRYSDDGEVGDSEDTNLDKIEVTFPSPKLLIGQTLQEELQIADSNADYISNVMVPAKQDGSTEDTRLKMKAFIFKDIMPNIDYEKYENYLKNELKIDMAEDKVKAAQNTPQENQSDSYY